MPITAEQREQRRCFIGSSDAAAIMGVSPWATAHDVWVEKVHPTTPRKPSPAMVVGNRFEGVITDWAVERLGAQRVEIKDTLIGRNRIMGANVDSAVSVGGKVLPVEAKWSTRSEGWGEEDMGIEGVPLAYVVQVFHQISVMECGRGFLAAFLADRNELRCYEIVPTDAQLAAIEAREEHFWDTYVVTKTPPPATEPASLETLGRILRMPGKSVPIDGQLVRLWREFDAAAKDAQKRADESKAAVIAALGNAEAGECELGTVTYKEQTRKSYIVNESTFRVARFNAAPGVEIGGAA